MDILLYDVYMFQLKCLDSCPRDISNRCPGSQYGRLRDLLPALRGNFKKFGKTKLKNWEAVLGTDLGQAKVRGTGGRGGRGGRRGFQGWDRGSVSDRG